MISLIRALRGPASFLGIVPSGRVMNNAGTHPLERTHPLEHPNQRQLTARRDHDLLHRCAEHARRRVIRGLHHRQRREASGELAEDNVLPVQLGLRERDDGELRIARVRPRICHAQQAWLGLGLGLGLGLELGPRRSPG